MATFLVETFTPSHSGVAVDALVAAARSAAETAAGEGLEVRHVRTFLAPRDEICFHLFEAPSAAAVERMAAIGRLTHERITEVIG